MSEFIGYADLADFREVIKRAFANFANQNVGSAARFHYELNGLSGAGMGCLVEMFKLSITTFGN